MAKEVEQQSLRDYGNRKKRFKQRRRFFIVMLLLIVVAVGITYFVKLQNKTYQGFQIVNRITNQGSNNANYISYGKSVVRFSRDGATAIDQEGKLTWNGSYEMNDPKAATCGKYVVIYDRGNKLINIFNEKGSVNSITTLYNINKVEVANQGVIAVLMDDEKTSYITMFSEDGAELTEQSASYVNKDGYPIDIALSEDGKKLIISYFSVSTGVLVSKVAFYNYGEVGKNKNADRLVGGIPYEEILIPRVSFIGNNTVCVYKENGFELYAMSEIPKFVYEETFEQKIHSVFHNKKYAGFILENEEGGSLYRLLLYDLEGKKILDKKLDFTYDKVMISGKDIILNNSLACMIMNTKGRVKFNYTFTTNIAALLPINNVDRYFLIDTSELCEIKLEEQISVGNANN